MVAFPPPPITLRQRSSTFAEPPRSLWRVLASGCHSFLSDWLEKVSQPSLAEPFGSDLGVVRIDSRLPHLSFGCHHTDCRSLCQSRGPQPSRQGDLYSSLSFRSNFCVFYFWCVVISEVCRVRPQFFPGPTAFLQRFCILFLAKKILSNHLFDDVEQCERANAARFD